MKEILLIEDDTPLSNGICLALKTSEITIVQCFDLHSAKKLYNKRNFDLFILDINLPDGNGLDFLKEIKQTNNAPVIILTANDMEFDIVSGLELGADDYITKPFSLAILRARVNTQLRKTTTITSTKIEIDDYVFDFEHMEYMKNGILIELSKTEQKLLRCLIENRGIILSRETLVDRIWTDGAEYVDENALSVTIKRLRSKLEETPANPKFIKTVYGIGYTWVVNNG